MNKQLKLSFFQTFSMTFIWILLLISIFLNDITFSVNYTWNLVGISAISASIFGIMYPALWNFSSMKAFNKIAISSIVNTLGGLVAVWLFSISMFNFIKPWIIGIFILTVIGHIISFYFYSKWYNDKNSDELNNLLKK